MMWLITVLCEWVGRHYVRRDMLQAAGLVPRNEHVLRGTRPSTAAGENADAEAVPTVTAQRPIQAVAPGRPWSCYVTQIPELLQEVEQAGMGGQCAGLAAAFVQGCLRVLATSQPAAAGAPPVPLPLTVALSAPVENTTKRYVSYDETAGGRTKHPPAARPFTQHEKRHGLRRRKTAPTAGQAAAVARAADEVETAVLTGLAPTAKRARFRATAPPPPPAAVAARALELQDHAAFGIVQRAIGAVCGPGVLAPGPGMSAANPVLPPSSATATASPAVDAVLLAAADDEPACPPQTQPAGPEPLRAAAVGPDAAMSPPADADMSDSDDWTLAEGAARRRQAPPGSLHVP